MINNFIFEICLYSHFFQISRITYPGSRLLGSFVTRFAMMELVKRPSGPGFSNEVSKMFAASTSDRQEVRIHINAYANFIVYLKENHVLASSYRINVAATFTPISVTMNVKP